MNDNLDQDGYPTEEALGRIRTTQDPNEALRALEETWNDRYGSVSSSPSYNEWQVARLEDGDHALRFATGGWSGNEDALEAFGQNAIAWMMTWRLSAVGGLFIFRRPSA